MTIKPATLTQALDLLAEANKQRDALKEQLRIARRVNFSSDAIKALRAERDALRDALTLAVATLERVRPAHTHGPFCTLDGTLDVARAAIEGVAK